MFDVGFAELLLVFVVMLLVVGPERLPGVAKKIGLYLRKARRSFNDLRNEVERELEAEELKQKLKKNTPLEDVESVREQLNEVDRLTGQTIGEEAKPRDD